MLKVTLGAVLAALVMAAPSMPLQQTGRTLSGTVYDATGGAIPGVTLGLVDSRGTRASATTNSEGRFDFAGVAPGIYAFDAALPGFQTLRQSVELRGEGDWTRAVILQVGELSEALSIRASRLQPQPASPGGAPQAPIRVGGQVRPPIKEFDVRPDYPASMRQAGVAGIVPIEAMIGKDGSVSAVRVMSAPVHPDLAIAAANAVRQWRYRPTLLNGVAVDIVMTVTVTFEID